MLHMLENLSQKQNDLELKMRDTSAELLAKLQAIDSVATAQAEWRNSIDEIRTQLTLLRTRLDREDEVPVALGGKK
jgi:chromosome segregation ATPase